MIIPGKSHDYPWVIVFKKLPFQMFSARTNSSCLTVVTKSVDSRPTRRNKAAFSNFFGLVPDVVSEAVSTLRWRKMKTQLYFCSSAYRQH